MRRATPALTVALLLLGSSPLLAGQITFNFDCILVNKTTCSPSTLYGTMTLSDAPGNGDLLLTLDLAGSYDKFRHLMLNYSGPADRITSLDRQAELDTNDFRVRPYKGRFDVGDDDGKGWSYSGTGPYSTVLLGWTDHGRSKPKYTAGRSSVDLILEDFFELDRFGQIYAALYIKDAAHYRCDDDDDDDGPCERGVYRNGLSVGATLADSSITAPAPEPASLTLLGVGLATLAVRARRKAAARRSASRQSV